MTATASFFDDIADGIDAVAQVTGVAWVWERIKDLVRPVFDLLALPFRPLQRRYDLRHAAQLEEIAALVAPQVPDSAGRLSAIAADIRSRWPT